MKQKLLGQKMYRGRRMKESNVHQTILRDTGHDTFVTNIDMTQVMTRFIDQRTSQMKEKK